MMKLITIMLLNKLFQVCEQWHSDEKQETAAP